MINKYGQSPTSNSSVLPQGLKSYRSIERDHFAQSPKAINLSYGINQSTGDLRSEIRQLKDWLDEMSQRISQNYELIVNLQDEFRAKLSKCKIDENDCVEKIKMQLMTLERKMLDDQRKERGDMNQINIKLCDIRTELESKLIIIEENIKQLGDQGCHRKWLNNQFEVQDNLDKLNIQLEYLSKNKLDIHSPEFRKMRNFINQIEYQTYHIDKLGYLLDCHGTYLLDENGNIVRLNQKQMEHLKMQFQV